MHSSQETVSKADLKPRLNLSKHWGERLMINNAVARVLKNGLSLLGIEVVEKM